MIRLLFLILLTTTFCFVVVLILRHDNKNIGVPTKLEKGENFPKQGYIPLNKTFFEAQLFNDSVQGTSQEKFSKGRIRGGVIPHHLLASHMIADFFEKLSMQGNIKTIVLIGPNHFGKEQSFIYSSNYDWEVPNGFVSVNKKIVDELLEEGFVIEGKDIFLEEHAIGGLIPFVSEYLPNVNIVPIVIGNSIKDGDRNGLVEKIVELMNGEDIVVIGSIDFSHYLTMKEAEEMDSETREALENWNLELIESWDDKHLDSPQSLVVVMEIVRSLRVKNVEVLENTNSGRILNKPFEENTSYFEVIFF